MRHPRPQARRRTHVGGMPVVSAAAEEPPRPRDEVMTNATGTRLHEGRDGPGAAHPPATADTPAPADQRVRDHRVHPDPRDDVQARPLHGGRGTERRRRPPAATAGSTAAVPTRAARRRPRERRPRATQAVWCSRSRSDEPERQQDEERQDAVQQRDPAHHDRQPVDRDQKRATVAKPSSAMSFFATR